MLDKIKRLVAEVDEFSTTDSAEIEEFRVKFLGKKGILNGLFKDFRVVSGQEKKELGQLLNGFRSKVQEKLSLLKGRVDAGRGN